MEELLIYTTNKGACAVDLHSGNNITQFKNDETAQNLSVFLPNTPSGNPLLLSAQTKGAMLHVYSWNRESVDQQIVLPEKLSCLGASPCGTWLAGGSNSGRLFVWELASGKLVFSREVHYQAVTKVAFTEGLLFSTSKDARVLGWSLVTMAADPKDAQPAITWTDHNLGVVDLVVGGGPSRDSRVFTLSNDKTVRIWDVSSAALLTTITLPAAEQPSCLAVDQLERTLFIGCVSGKILQISLYDVSPSTGLVSVGGASGVVESGNVALSHHKERVTSLALSFDATLLVSADDKGSICVWDLPSRQVSKTIKQPRAEMNPVTYVQTVTTHGLPTEKYNPKTAVKLPMLKRVQDDKPEDHDILVKIKPTNKLVSQEDHLVALVESAQFGGDSLAGKVVQLENELQQAKSSFASLKESHETLWGIYQRGQ